MIEKYPNGYLLTYLRLLPLVEEHRPLTSILHPTLSWAFLSSSFQLLFILFISASISRRSVFFGLPLFRFPSLFQVKDWVVMQFGDFLNVCPIHFQRLFLISSSAGSWFVLSHKTLLLIVSGQWMLSILRRQLFINTCTFLMMAVVVLHVSAPYSRTDCFDIRNENSQFEVSWQLFWVPYVLQL